MQRNFPFEDNMTLLGLISLFKEALANFSFLLFEFVCDDIYFLNSKLNIATKELLGEEIYSGDLFDE